MTKRLPHIGLLMLLGLNAGFSCNSSIPIDPPVPTVTIPPPPQPPPIESDFVSGEFPHPLSVGTAQEILLRSRVFDLPLPRDPRSNKSLVYLPPLASDFE